MPFQRKWTYEDKMQAALWYLLTGSINKTAKATGIPRATVQSFAKTNEWELLLEEARRSQGAKIDANLAKIIRKAHSAVSDRLDKGDAVVDKNGNLRFRPVSARDAMMIAAIAQDKQALVRGKPQRITASDTSLNKLKEGLKQISQEEELARRKEEEALVEQVLSDQEDRSS